MKVPVELVQGTGMVVKGTVKSKYKITKVSASIKGSKYSASAKPKGKVKSFNLATWDSKLLFSKLAGSAAGVTYSYVVKATDASGASKTWTQKFTVVTALKFKKVGTPSITGVAQVGEVVTAKPGTWSPKASFSYQWYRDGTTINGATKSTYTLVVADQDTKVTVKAKGKAAGYKDTWSAASKAVAVTAGDTYIDVDMTAQKLTYVKNGVVVLTSDVVTGLPVDGVSPTPTGTFTLTQKLSPHQLFYNQRATYWMRLDDTHIGLHDATWQPQFGGTWYQTNGSHGCINMPLDKAKQLYESVTVGTPVTVHE